MTTTNKAVDFSRMQDTEIAKLLQEHVSDNVLSKDDFIHAVDELLYRRNILRTRGKEWYEEYKKIHGLH